MIKETTTLAREAAHAAPPATYAVTHYFLGYTWPEWSAAAIFFYTIMQMVRAYPKTQRCVMCFVTHRWKCNGTCKELK